MIWYTIKSAISLIQTVILDGYDTILCPEPATCPIGQLNWIPKMPSMGISSVNGYRELNQLEESQKALEKAVALDPTWSLSQYDLATGKVLTNVPWIMKMATRRQATDLRTYALEVKDGQLFVDA